MRATTAQTDNQHCTDAEGIKFALQMAQNLSPARLQHDMPQEDYGQIVAGDKYPHLRCED